ncbi:ATP-binding cassette domain-containing protein [Paracoccaceae bacterium]|nr:ATP-binding cassette domain-containing protein [Paracoccaceae bacterium]
MSDTIFEARNLSCNFDVTISPVRRLSLHLAGAAPPSVRAVEDVSLKLEKGKTLGIVGESGCGKSTLARMVAGILPESSGKRFFRGEDYGSLLSRPFDALRIQMVFQDPLSSINPRLRVVDIVGEAPVVHGLISRSEKREYVQSILEEVGLSPDTLDRYPHQFSGGQRQRVGIARALAVQPDLLICDEAVAALDVSLQAQIVNLLMDIRAKQNLSMIFISHDLSVVRHLCDEVAVMYLGRVVEHAETAALFKEPMHPYTHTLLEGMPRISLHPREFMPIRGEIPSPLNPPGGCHFHPRCAFATDECGTLKPELREMDPLRLVRCHNAESIRSTVA